MIAAATDSFVPDELNDVQQRALDELRRDGIAVVSFEELFGAQLWRDAVADIEPFIRETEAAAREFGDRPRGKEEVIVRRFLDKAAADGDKPRFALDSPWLRAAASDQLLGIVNAYRGRPTRLFYLDNWYTVPYPGINTRVASQRWHRDPEDEHVVKVFTYFSEVDDEAGPFQYIRSSTAGGRYGDLWPWGVGDHWYPPPDELEQAIADEDRLTMTGPAGTVILCDTGGFHRGGFARTKPRILSVSTYFGKKGKRRFETDFQGAEATLSPQARAALG
jgi:hypothetical protein